MAQAPGPRAPATRKTRFGREGVKRAEMLGCRMNLDRGDAPYERLADLAAAIVD